MKYLFNTLYLLCFVSLLFSCDKEQTEELMTEKRKLEDYRITFLEYARLPEDSAPNQNKYFDEENPAKNYLPDWLLSKLFQIEDLSSVVVAYKFKQERNSELESFNRPVYLLKGKDYMQAWGGIPYVHALTPTVSPELKIPELLQYQQDVSEGSKQLVEYNYSSEDAFIKPNNHIFYLLEDFNTSDSTLSNFGWDNRTRNLTRRWILRTFNNDSRALATVNGVSEPEKTQLDSWLISAEVDLTQAIDPKLSFDLGLGYFSGDLFFSVHVIEADHYKSDEEIKPEAWRDISDLFNLPSSGPSGYGALLNCGEVSLKEYVGKIIRVGFRYTGKINPDYNMGTSYELDNVKIEEVADQLVVSSAEAKYVVFSFDNGQWKMLNDDHHYVMQPDDYEFLNVESIDTDKASLLLPKVLAKKNISSEGNIRVVYKNSPQSAYADDFSFIDGVWKQVSPLHIITREDKYKYSESNNQWFFIETIN